MKNTQTHTRIILRKDTEEVKHLKSKYYCRGFFNLQPPKFSCSFNPISMKPQVFILHFPDGVGGQRFSSRGHECLLLLIIGRLIDEGWVHSARPLVGDGLTVKGLEHWVTRGQGLPVAVLEPPRQGK